LLLPLLAPLLLLLSPAAAAAPPLLLLFCTVFVLFGLGILLPPALLLLLLLPPGLGVLLPLLPCRLKGSTFVVPPGCNGVPDTPTWKRAPSLPVSNLQTGDETLFCTEQMSLIANSV
jgi:hypothetical protein